MKLLPKLFKRRIKRDSLGSIDRILETSSYDGDKRLVYEVSQAEYKVARETDEKPVLATFGTQPCVGVLGFADNRYSPKIGFLAHFESLANVKESLPGLIAELRPYLELGKMKVSTFGGFPGISEEILCALTIWIRIAGFEMGVHSYFKTSAALDTRTGQVFSYEGLRFNESKKE